jgi:hypothetical protein
VGSVVGDAHHPARAVGEADRAAGGVDQPRTEPDTGPLQAAAAGADEQGLAAGLHAAAEPGAGVTCIRPSPRGAFRALADR